MILLLFPEHLLLLLQSQRLQLHLLLFLLHLLLIEPFISATLAVTLKAIIILWLIYPSKFHYSFFLEFLWEIDLPELIIIKCPRARLIYWETTFLSVVIVVVPGCLIQGIRGDILRKCIDRMGSIRKLLGS